MKLASFIVHGRTTYGVVDGDQLIDLESVKPTVGTDLKQAITAHRLGELTPAVLASLPRVAIADVTFLPVIANPGKVLCIGINYATHVRETGRDMRRRNGILMRAMGPAAMAEASSTTSSLRPSAIRLSRHTT